MRHLFATEFVTLDGVMEAPGGEPSHPHTGWVSDYFEDELLAYKMQETMDSEALLLGRVTYESFAGAWPTYEGEFAVKMNAMPKHVVSSTLTDPQWTNSTALGAYDPAAIAALKAGRGGPIQVAGSRTLLHALILDGLLDELHLQVFPVLLGSGDRVFPDSPDKRRLTLTQNRVLGSGVQLQHFVPAG